MTTLKERAIKLRTAGYSYSMIRKKIGVPKATLSNWLTFIPFKPNKAVLNQIGGAKLKSALYKQNLKFEDIARMKVEAKKDIGVLSERDMFMLGVGLYMGEGSKSFEQVQVTNSDPIIIKTAMIWLKTFLKLDTKNFIIQIHAYPDTDLVKSVNFWSKETGIPASQFSKTIIDNRRNKSKLNKRKLPYGTVGLRIKNGGTISPGIKSLHRKIMGWIDSSTKQIKLRV